MDIDRLDADDLEDLSKLFVRTFDSEPWNDSWTNATAAKRLRDIVETPGAIGVVGREDGLVGFALGTLEQSDAAMELNLRERCVDPARQRNGHGRMLLHELHRAAHDAGASRAYLQTARDGAAAAFYEANGYRAARRQHIYVGDLTFD